MTLVSYLKTLHDALGAAETLAGEGVSVEVFDPRTLVPFDREGLRASLERTGRLLIAHEAPQPVGFGAEIAAIAAEECFDLLRAPVVRVCGRNTPFRMHRSWRGSSFRMRRGSPTACAPLSGRG